MGSCSSKRTTTAGVGERESEKRNVESSGERESNGHMQSSEEAKSLQNVSREAGGAASERRSGEGDVSSVHVDAKFSNKDDVIVRNQDTGSSLQGRNEGEKSDDPISDDSVSKDTLGDDDDATRTDVNSGIPLRGSSSVVMDTDTKVRKSVGLHCSMIYVHVHKSLVFGETGNDIWLVCPFNA